MVSGGSLLSLEVRWSVGSPWWLSIVTRGPKLAVGGSLLSLEVSNGPGWLPTVTRGQVVADGGSAL